MQKHTMYVRIVGEPFLSRVLDYRRRLGEVSDAWRAFMEEKGADGVPHNLCGLNFTENDAPAGWTKPNRKHGFSRPKKGNPDADRIKALPGRPKTWDIFGDAIITDLRYKSPDGKCWGVGAIGVFWYGPSIGWCEETYFALIPDAKSAAEAHLKDYPDHIIENGADKWTVPAGLSPMTEAEYKFMLAEFDLRWERKKQAA